MRHVLLALALVIAVGAPAEAVIYWTETFEDPSLPGWVLFTTPLTYPPTGVTTDRPFNGLRSLKINYPATSQHGGPINDRDFTTTEEVYIREFRYDSFDVLPSPAFTKVHFVGSHSTLDVSKPDFWVDYEGSNDSGGSTLHRPYVAGQLIYGRCGQQFMSGTEPLNNGLDGCNFHWNSSNLVQPNGKWFCWEVHFKMNTPGQANGVIEMWGQNMTDGGPNIQTMGYYAVEMRGPQIMQPPGCGVVSTTDCNSSLKTFNFYRNYRQEGQGGDRWLDDLAVSSTRIGCGAAQPALNTPANLLICRGALCTPASVLPLPLVIAAALWLRRALKRRR